MNVTLCRDTDWIFSEEAFLLYASCMHHPKYEDFKIQMECFLNDSSFRVFVCEKRGKKTAIMILKYLDAVVEIIGIAVSQKFRRQGLGRYMIQFLMESEGFEKIEAQTDDYSVGFYRRCGFALEKIVVNYPDGSVVRYNCILNR